MTIKHGHTDTSGVNSDGFVSENFLSLPNHLHFFSGVTIFKKSIDVRNHVECDLSGVHLWLSFFAVQKSRRLPGKLFNVVFTRAANRLISCDIDSFDTRYIVDRL